MRKVYRLTRFSVLPTAKLAGVLYCIFGVIAAVFILATTLFTPDQAQWFSLVLAICAPFLYGFFGFVCTALGCWLYNVVAGWIGGIEWEQEELPGPERPAPSPADY